MVIKIKSIYLDCLSTALYENNNLNLKVWKRVFDTLTLAKVTAHAEEFL